MKKGAREAKRVIKVRKNDPVHQKGCGIDRKGTKTTGLYETYAGRRVSMRSFWWYRGFVCTTSERRVTAILLQE